MSRATEWRKICPKMVKQNQIRAMEIDTLFLVRQNGPLAFSVQSIDQLKPFEVIKIFGTPYPLKEIPNPNFSKLMFQVRLGDPHKCSCKYFKIAADLCLHICWILLRKFQIHTSDTASYQVRTIFAKL